MKVCSKCGKYGSFRKNKQKKDGLQTLCKDCQSPIHKEWYKNNKSKRLDLNRQFKIKIRQIINNLKDNPCTDCNRKFPSVCMDFDHLDPKEKKFSIASLNGSLESILEEIKKCELVCANCHRIRTHK